MNYIHFLDFLLSAVHNFFCDNFISSQCFHKQADYIKNSILFATHMKIITNLLSHIHEQLHSIKFKILITIHHNKYKKRMAWFQYLIPVYNLLQVRHHFPAETGTCSLCPAQSTSFNKLEIPKCQSKHYYFRRALERPNPKMSKKGQNEKNCRRSMEVSLFFLFFTLGLVSHKCNLGLKPRPSPLPLSHR